MTSTDAEATPPSPVPASPETGAPAEATSTAAEVTATTGATATAAEATATAVVETAAEQEPDLSDPAALLSALGWVGAEDVGAPAHTAALPARDPGLVAASADLLADRPRRSALRPGVLVPLGLILVIVLAYCGVALFWPLTAIPPQAAVVSVTPAAAPAAAIHWPAAGSAAVSVRGIPGSPASTSAAAPIASITKLVTALTVLDQMPLQVGQQGPLFHFTYADHREYVQYTWRNESALDVPVGGTLSEYQLLQGMLIGSASNYAARLAGNLWPTDAVFANAANTWLQQHGVSGITVVDPTGFEYGNVATPAGLMALAQKALENPVIAQIVGMASVDLPGAGHVVNTNELLSDAGVIGVKTGTLDGYDLLAAKQVKIGSTTVTMYATTLRQPDDKTRWASTRALFAQLESELQLRPSVTAGTVAGEVTTRWGETVDVVTRQDADVVLWNGGSAKVSSTFALGSKDKGAWKKGATAGALTTTGPLDQATVPLVLARTIQGPSPLWRLTHPLELLGLS